MKYGRIWPSLAAVLAMAVAGGCGTVVFFPQKSAEIAADKILNDILAPANGKEADGAREIAKAPESVPVRAQHIGPDKAP